MPDEVLHGVSLRVEPGHTLALVGPSGAGKSTIAGLVSRLYDPTGGAVRVGGVDLRDTTLADVRDTVGVVAQDVHLFHDTLRANLRLRQARTRPTPRSRPPCGRPRSGTSSPACPTASTPSSATAATACPAARSSASPSPGCCSRTPASSILDEATAHLDAGSEAAVQAALATALADRTSIVIAHRLATVRAADEIAVIDGGRVVERGTHDELVAAGGLYAALSRTQFADGRAPGRVTGTVEPWLRPTVDWGDDERRLTDTVSVLVGPGNGAYPSGNSLLVRGAGESLIIDPSVTVVERGGAPVPVDAVVNSHSHEDHVAGNGFFADARIHVHDDDLPGVHSLQGLMDVYGMPIDHPFATTIVEEFHYTPRPDAEGFNDGHVFDLGGGDDRRGRPPARPHPRPQRLPRRRRVLPVRHRPHRVRPVLRRRVERPRGLRGQPGQGPRRGRPLLRDVPPQGRHRGPRRVPAPARRLRRP